MVKKVTTNSPAKLLHETNAGYLGSFDDPFNSGKDIILSTNIEHLEESNQTSSIKVNSGCDVQVESILNIPKIELQANCSVTFKQKMNGPLKIYGSDKDSFIIPEGGQMDPCIIRYDGDQLTVHMTGEVMDNDHIDSNSKFGLYHLCKPSV